jgi:hypothetical protein
LVGTFKATSPDPSEKPRPGIGRSRSVHVCIVHASITPSRKRLQARGTP